MQESPRIFWSTWEHSRIIAFTRIPEIQQHKTYGEKSKCAKQLYILGNSASIRSKGTWVNGEAADDENLQWAEKHWPFEVKTELEGAKGVLSKCSGELA